MSHSSNYNHLPSINTQMRGHADGEMENIIAAQMSLIVAAVICVYVSSLAQTQFDIFSCFKSKHKFFLV